MSVMRGKVWKERDKVFESSGLILGYEVLEFQLLCYGWIDNTASFIFFIFFELFVNLIILRE